MFRGHAEEVTEEEQLAALRLEPLLPWAPGAKKHYVRVNASLVSGRRISLADVPSNWWG